MILKLWCWLWGHRYWYKTVTGQKFTETYEVITLYEWRKSPICRLCHKESK